MNRLLRSEIAELTRVNQDSGTLFGYLLAAVVFIE